MRADIYHKFRRRRRRRRCRRILFTYNNWPAPPTIHRGVEWSQFLNCSLFVCLFVCLFVLCLIVGKFSNYSSHPPLNKIFSNSSPHPPLLARPPEYLQRIRVASVFELSVCLFVCLFWANFLISHHMIISYDFNVI